MFKNLVFDEIDNPSYWDDPLDGFFLGMGRELDEDIDDLEKLLPEDNEELLIEN